MSEAKQQLASEIQNCGSARQALRTALLRLGANLTFRNETQTSGRNWLFCV